MTSEPPDDPGFVDDDDIQRCGVPKTTDDDGDPCRHRVPNGDCPVHGDRDDRRQAIQDGDVQIRDGVGSGAAESNPLADGGGAPEGNKNAMSHGVHAVRDDPQGTLDWLAENRERGHRWVMNKWESYLADAPFDADSAKADDVLHACLMLYAGRRQRDQQVLNGLTTTQTRTSDSGQTFDIEVEHPGNLPANRITREARSWLKDLGILDDPESQKADALADWGKAAKRVAERQDSAQDGSQADD